MSTENEMNWSVAVCAACGAALAVTAVMAAVVAVWRVTPVFLRGGLCATGTLIAAAGLWLCAWECGRRFEREHGERECGERGEGEVGSQELGVRS